MAALHLSADLVGVRTGAPTSNAAMAANGTDQPLCGALAREVTKAAYGLKQTSRLPSAALRVHRNKDPLRTSPLGF